MVVIGHHDAAWGAPGFAAPDGAPGDNTGTAFQHLRPTMLLVAMEAEESIDL